MLSQAKFQGYLDRIGYQSKAGEMLQPSIETLRTLHEAHVSNIPFENIDVFIGKTIKLDEESIYSKLVEQKRGGYCYETNELFALALEYIGFKVHRLVSRVLFPETRSRGHKILLIEIKHSDGVSYWLADLGFGANSLRYPVLLPRNEVLLDKQQNDVFQIIKEKDKFDNIFYTLQLKIKDKMTNLYSFNLQETLSIDFELLNFALSKKDDSPFIKQRICAKLVPNGRLLLVDNILKLRTDAGVKEEVLDYDQYLSVLEKTFAIKLDCQEEQGLKMKLAQPARLTFF